MATPLSWDGANASFCVQCGPNSWRLPEVGPLQMAPTLQVAVLAVVLGVGRVCAQVTPPARWAEGTSLLRRDQCAPDKSSAILTNVMI